VVGGGLFFAPSQVGTSDATGYSLGGPWQAATLSASTTPAFGPKATFTLEGGVLQGRTVFSLFPWDFAGDGALVSAPLAINDLVVVGSSHGALYALDGETGTELWSTHLDGGVPPGPSWGSRMPFSGLAAGDGLLVVPAGRTLTAFRLERGP
jgi:hypothetical protein